MTVKPGSTELTKENQMLLSYISMDEQTTERNVLQDWAKDAESRDAIVNAVLIAYYGTYAWRK